MFLNNKTSNITANFLAYNNSLLLNIYCGGNEMPLFKENRIAFKKEKNFRLPEQFQ